MPHTLGILPGTDIGKQSITSGGVRTGALDPPRKDEHARSSQEPKQTRSALLGNSRPRMPDRPGNLLWFEKVKEGKIQMSPNRTFPFRYLPSVQTMPIEYEVTSMLSAPEFKGLPSQKNVRLPAARLK